MPENLPEELLTCRDDAERFLDEVVKPRTESITDLDDVPAALFEEVRQASKQAGFFYKTQPEEYGGNPATTLELTMLRELFAAANSPLTGAIFGPGPGVLHAAEGSLKENYLEPLMRELNR